eukprot:3821289-Pyramimonas_sp.AAC.1
MLLTLLSGGPVGRSQREPSGGEGQAPRVRLEGCERVADEHRRALARSLVGVGGECSCRSVSAAVA